MEYLHIYLVVGLCVGFLSGLFGVGGGIVIVPALSFCFAALNFSPEFSLRAAIGTSLACIVFGAIASAREHNKRGAVDWRVVRQLTPGILIGTVFGSLIATYMPVRLLKIVFVCFLLYAATQSLLNFKPKATRELPRLPGMSVAGSVIGLISSFVGIGGGTVSVPFMLWCNVSMHNAIGTSAALGFPIAMAGMIGYMVNGFNQPDLPAYSVGYVYLPALLGIASMSILSARVGVHLAHKLPVGTLKKAFGILLYAIGLKMAYGLFA